MQIGGFALDSSCTLMMMIVHNVYRTAQLHKPQVTISATFSDLVLTPALKTTTLLDLTILFGMSCLLESRSLYSASNLLIPPQPCDT